MGIPGNSGMVREEDSMQELSASDFKIQAVRAGLTIDMWPEGTIRLNPPQDYKAFDISADAIPSADPPLIAAYREPRTSHRYMTVESKPELDRIIAAAVNGWSVDDDLYLFPPSGAFMLYAGHHGTITVWHT